MTGQPSLFDEALVSAPAVAEPAARATDPDTSVGAARRAAVSAGTNRARALAVHAQHPDGLTDFELAAITGVAQTSIGCRRKELVRAGYVAQTDERRPAPSGSPAIVWRITADGARVARTVAA